MPAVAGPIPASCRRTAPAGSRGASALTPAVPGNLLVFGFQDFSAGKLMSVVNEQSFQ